MFYIVCVPSYLRDIYPNKITQPLQITLRMKMQYEKRESNKKRLRISWIQREVRHVRICLRLFFFRARLQPFERMHFEGFSPCICRMAFWKRREKKWKLKIPRWNSNVYCECACRECVCASKDRIELIMYLFASSDDDVLIPIIQLANAIAYPHNYAFAVKNNNTKHIVDYYSTIIIIML